MASHANDWEREVTDAQLALVAETLGTATVTRFVRDYCADAAFGYPHRNVVMHVCLRIITLLGPEECTRSHVERALLSEHSKGEDWPTREEAERFRQGRYP